MPERQRPEPTLGEFDGLDAEQLESNQRRRRAEGSGRAGARAPAGSTAGRPGAARSGSRRARRQRRRFVTTLIGVVLVLGTALAVWLNQDWLRQQVSGSDTASLVEAAARAEQQGRWHGSVDGDDALSLYRRILAADADNDPARLGLRRVGEQLQVQVEQAIAAGDQERAGLLIQELAVLGLPGSRIEELQGRLQQASTSQAQGQALLAQARQALAAGDIEGDDGALALFRRLQASDSGNAVARRGIDDALAARLAQARQQVAAGDLLAAQAGIDLVAAQSAQHAGLPELRQMLAQAQAEQAAAEQQRLAQAQAEQAEQARQQQARDLAAAIDGANAHLAAGRLPQAGQGYRRALGLDPEHEPARRGLARVAAESLAQAEAAIADSNSERGRQLLAQARQAGAGESQLAPLAERLDALEGRLASVLARPELSAAEQQRLDALMNRARAADQAGRLVEPAGDSAYDLYRQVLSIDPMDEAARNGVNALPRRAQALANHHIELGQPDQADQAVAALQAMAPMNPMLPELKRQLAAAWLASAERALQAGATGQARQALERARALAPAHPDLPALAARLSGQ
ncbi:MAG: hypothetical protein M0Q42_02595 [Xanthomonadales bacterium]|nr:hypothetical protein [Xanthomonadales bacterium]